MATEAILTTDRGEFSLPACGIIAAAAVTLVLSSGALTAGATAFLVPLTTEFGWSHGQYSVLYMVCTYMCAAAGFFMARMADSIGSRRVILPVALTFPFALMGLSLMNGSLLQGAFLFGLAGIGAATAVVYFRLTALWFHRRLGMAFAITALTQGVLTAAYGPTVQAIFQQIGWRSTFLVLGALYLVVAVPLQWALVREPAGHLPGKNDSRPAQATLTGASLKEALRTPALWIIFIIDLIAMMIGSGVRLHIVPILGAHAIDQTTAIAISYGAMLCALAVRPVFGWALDAFNTPRAVVPFALLTILGMLALMLGTSALLFAPALFLMNAGTASEASSGNYFLARYFGRLHYGQIVAVIYLATPLGIGLGPLLLGYLRDHTGGHTLGLTVMAVLSVVCLLSLFALRGYRYTAKAPSA